MRRILVASAVTLSLAVTAPAASAQDCVEGAATGMACVTARDLFVYLAPQLGTALTGASHTLGIGTNLGGFPHFALALRVNAVVGGIPTLTDVTVGPAAPQSKQTEAVPIGLPTVDFALGLTKGFSLGVTRIGGIDLIGGATYIPELEMGDNGTITPQGGSLAIGLGARVGLLQQSALIPGVAFSILSRNLPTIDLATSTPGGDTFNINDFAVKTTSWRLSAQKNLLLFQLGAGIGGDTYDFSTNGDVTIDPAGVNQQFSFATAQKMTRTTMYGSLGINLFIAKVVAEVGQVSGGNAVTYHDYDEPADKTRLYGSVGVRISF